MRKGVAGQLAAKLETVSPVEPRSPAFDPPSPNLFAYLQIGHIMSDVLSTPTFVKELDSTTPSNHGLFQLPTELLIFIVAALDAAHLEAVPRFSDPLPALRL